jgi:hypothetical protein
MITAIFYLRLSLVVIEQLLVGIYFKIYSLRVSVLSTSLLGVILLLWWVTLRPAQ